MKFKKGDRVKTNDCKTHNKEFYGVGTVIGYDLPKSANPRPMVRFDKINQISSDCPTIKRMNKESGLCMFDCEIDLFQEA